MTLDCHSFTFFLFGHDFTARQSTGSAETSFAGGFRDWLVLGLAREKPFLLVTGPVIVTVPHVCSYAVLLSVIPLSS